MLEPQLQIEVFPVGDQRVLVVVEGELDLPEAGQLRAILNDVCAGPAKVVVVDLGGVGFIGSSGLGVLASTHNDLAEAQRTLVVRGASPAIRKALQITGLDRLLELE